MQQCLGDTVALENEGYVRMTTQAIARRRRPRGLHPKRTDGEPQPKRLPEYLEADEVNAVIRAAEDPRAKLLMLTQWRAGLRVSEALALDVSDLSLDSDLPTIRVRSGKGRKARVVPVHPELAAAFRMALSYGNVGRAVSSRRTGPRRGGGCRRRWRERSGSAPSRPAGESGPTRFAIQLCPASSDARSPDQLPFVAGSATRQHTDDADLSGIGAGSDGESGGGAVRNTD